MLADQNKCDMGKLVRLVEQELTPKEATELETHLSDCTTCQASLESLAGPKSFWADVGKRLGDLSLDGVSRGDTKQGAKESAKQFLGRILGPSDHPEFIGRIGRYGIKSLVGVGGMAIVVKAFDPTLSRVVAIKILSSHLAANGSARERFLREAKAAATVAHDNVLDIHAIGEQEGLPYLVMPYIRGGSLAQRVDKKGPLSTIETLQILHQVCNGLDAAHRQAIIHRDIKPANVLIDDEGTTRVKIADFGLARVADDASLTGSGTISGTPLFMSPEQARGDQVDFRSDLFSLGAVGYVMCTGHAPFRAETPYGVIRRILEEPPRSIHASNPQVPDWLCRVIEQLMAKEPGQRIQTAREASEVLQAGLHFENRVTSGMPDLLKKFEPRANAGWLKLSGFALMTILLLIAIYFSFSQFAQKGNSNAAISPNDKNDPVIVLDQKPPGPNQSTSSHSSTERKEGEAKATPALYRFASGTQHCYSLGIVFWHGESKIKIDGAFRFEVVSVDGEFADIRYQLHLPAQVESQVLNLRPAMSRTSSMLSIVQQCERKGRARIHVSGKISGRSRKSFLPAQLGPVLELIFPQLPKSESLETDAVDLDLAISQPHRSAFPMSTNVDFVFAQRKWTLTRQQIFAKRLDRESLRSSVEIIDRDQQGRECQTTGQFIFDHNTGFVESFDLDRKATVARLAEFASVEFRLRRVGSEETNPFVQKHFLSEDLNFE